MKKVISLVCIKCLYFDVLLIQNGETVKNMIFESMLVDLNPLQSAAKYEAPDVAKALLDHGVS